MLSTDAKRRHGAIPKPGWSFPHHRIAATLVPTTMAGHRFWEAEDDTTATQQRIHFLKNLTIFGGLLIAAADTAGSPSLAWRTRRAARSARKQASLAARTAKVSGKARAKSGNLTSRVAR